MNRRFFLKAVGAGLVAAVASPLVTDADEVRRRYWALGAMPDARRHNLFSSGDSYTLHFQGLDLGPYRWRFKATGDVAWSPWLPIDSPVPGALTDATFHTVRVGPR